MLILGLDPGSRHTGYGLVQAEAASLRAVAFGRISCTGSQPLPSRLAHLVAELEGILARWRPQIAVLETPFHGLNSRSLVVLAQARGALLAALAGGGIEITEYAPSEVKSAVSGNGRADKSQVRRMVRLHLSMRNQALSEDASDALALAICYAHRRCFDGLVARTTPI